MNPSSDDNTSQHQLAGLLKQSREFMNLSVRKAATQAEISATYLSQLEAGAIKDPSPRVLYKLAQMYGISYLDLMVAAGYILPEMINTSVSYSTSSPLERALQTNPLTAEERNALAEYLAWYRSRHGRPPEER